MTTIKITLNDTEDETVLNYILPLVERGGRAAVIARNMLHRCVAYEMACGGASQDTGTEPSKPDLVIVDDSDDSLSTDLENLF